jgi:hypothetical protein
MYTKKRFYIYNTTSNTLNGLTFSVKRDINNNVDNVQKETMKKYIYCITQRNSSALSAACTIFLLVDRVPSIIYAILSMIV